MSGVNHVHEGATEHVGANDAWATELRGIREELRGTPAVMPPVSAWVDDPDPDGLAEIAANLDDIETRTVLALDALIDRALTRLECTR